MDPPDISSEIISKYQILFQCSGQRENWTFPSYSKLHDVRKKLCVESNSPLTPEEEEILISHKVDSVAKKAGNLSNSMTCVALTAQLLRRYYLRCPFLADSSEKMVALNAGAILLAGKLSEKRREPTIDSILTEVKGVSKDSAIEAESQIATALDFDFRFFLPDGPVYTHVMDLNANVFKEDIEKSVKDQFIQSCLQDFKNVLISDILLLLTPGQIALGYIYFYVMEKLPQMLSQTREWIKKSILPNIPSGAESTEVFCKCNKRVSGKA